MKELTKLDPKKLKEITDAFNAVCQPKTNFQIENFVVGQHDTPERRFAQCVTQLHILVCNIKRAEIQRKRILLDIRDLGKKKSERNLLNLEEKQIDLEQIEFSLKGALSEFATYYTLFSNMKKFTYEEIQCAEPIYWSLRLARQSQEDIEATGRIGQGNIDALWQSKKIANPAHKFIEQRKVKPDAALNP